MGKDKIENEELIKYGWPEDLWFHADKLSSAHVYVRMPRGTTIDELPQSVIDDCAQLTKENSIQGANNMISHSSIFPRLIMLGIFLQGRN